MVCRLALAPVPAALLVAVGCADGRPGLADARRGTVTRRARAPGVHDIRRTHPKTGARR